MRAELSARDAEPRTLVVNTTGAAADQTNLPPLETLEKLIPRETRAALDEHFRAKFVTVRRMPESALKS